MPRPLALAWAVLCSGLLMPLFAYAQAEELPPSLAKETPTPAASPTPADRSRPPPPAPAATEPTHPERGHGILVLPTLGFTSPIGSTAQDYSESYRLGALVGWHVSPKLSLNGECNIEFVDANTDQTFWRPHELMVDLTVSPLWHLRSSQLVVGPKLGWFGDARSESGLSGHGQGLVVGLNAGLFLPWRRVMVGVLVSAAFRHFVSFTCGGISSTSDTSCNQTGQDLLFLYGSRSAGGSYTGRGSNVETVGFSGAVLY